MSRTTATVEMLDLGLDKYNFRLIEYQLSYNSSTCEDSLQILSTSQQVKKRVACNSVRCRHRDILMKNQAIRLHSNEYVNLFEIRVKNEEEKPPAGMNYLEKSAWERAMSVTQSQLPVKIGKSLAEKYHPEGKVAKKLSKAFSEKSNSRTSNK